VVSGREKVNQMREEGEIKFMRWMGELRKDLQAQFEISLRSIKERSEVEGGSSSQLRQRRLDEVTNRCPTALCPLLHSYVSPSLPFMRLGIWMKYEQ
jgi:hypothetical protein